MYFIGKQLSLVIAHNGLNQTTFAKRIGVSQATISTLARNKTKATTIVINQICNEFHVNKYWLLTGEGEMFNSNINNIMANLFKPENELVLATTLAMLKMDETTHRSLRESILGIAGMIK